MDCRIGRVRVSGQQQHRYAAYENYFSGHFLIPFRLVVGNYRLHDGAGAFHYVSDVCPYAAQLVLIEAVVV